MQLKLFYAQTLSFTFFFFLLEHVYTNNNPLNTTALYHTHDHDHASQTTEGNLPTFTTSINLPIRKVSGPSSITISTAENNSSCTAKTGSSDNLPLLKNLQLENQTGSHDFYAETITSKTSGGGDIIKKSFVDATLTPSEQSQGNASCTADDLILNGSLERPDDFEKTNETKFTESTSKIDNAAISASLINSSISFVDSNSNKHTNIVLKDNNKLFTCSVCLIKIERYDFNVILSYFNT